VVGVYAVGYRHGLALYVGGACSGDIGEQKALVKTTKGFPKKAGWYWFEGQVYKKGPVGMGGVVRITSIARVLSDFCAEINGFVYCEDDLMQGKFTGPLPPPPWES